MSQKIKVGAGIKQELDNPDYSTWTLEQLLGVARTGRRRGRPPKVVPMERIREIARRLTPEAQLNQVIGAAAGMEYLRQVAAGEVVGEKERLTAAQYLVNRQFGTAPVTIAVAEEAVQLADIPPGLIARQIIIEADSKETPLPKEIGYDSAE